MEVYCDCLIEKLEKCTMQSALNVDRNVKSLSNQTQADQYIAATVGQRGEIREEVDIKLTS